MGDAHQIAPVGKLLGEKAGRLPVILDAQQLLGLSARALRMDLACIHHGSSRRCRIQQIAKSVCCQWIEV
jgi:hypothetical protein